MRTSGACAPVWQRTQVTVAAATPRAMRHHDDRQTKPVRSATVTIPPNNFPSLLLIVGGVVSAPLGIGVLLLITGLALMREANGEQSFPQLHGWIKWVQTVQFWRMIRL
jgi:hypothetical protein